MAMISEDSGPTLKAAFEFCEAMERHYEMRLTPKPVCRELMGYLAHFLGWGGEERSNEFSIRFSGVEVELERQYFWMNFAVYKSSGEARIVGAIMFRNDEWSAHS